MNIVNVKDCRGRTPPNHFDMRTFPLVEKLPDSGEQLALSLSYYLPGGGAAFGPQPVEVIFYLLDGALTIQTDNGERSLAAGEAVHISKGENKGIENRSNATATLLVIACVPDGQPGPENKRS